MTFPERTKREIQDVVSMYGCNMRGLIEVLSHGPGFIEDDIATKINLLETVTLSDLIRRDAESAGKMSHSLILSKCLKQPQPGTSAYDTSDALSSLVASHAVWRALAARRGKVFSEIANMLDLFRRVPEMAPSAGWLWESLCHGSISRGGKFSLTEMTEQDSLLVPSDQVIDLHVQQLDAEYFETGATNESTSDPRKYYIPNYGNNPTFDAFFHHEDVGVGLQMTLGRTHTLKAKGLLMLHRRLGARGEGRQQWFVFVIRKGSTFSCPKPSLKQTGRFRFFTLELEFTPGEHHFPSLADVSVDGLDSAEVQFDDALEMDRGDLKIDNEDEEDEDEGMLVDTK